MEALDITGKKILQWPNTKILIKAVPNLPKNKICRKQSKAAIPSLKSAKNQSKISQ